MPFSEEKWTRLAPSSGRHVHQNLIVEFVAKLQVNLSKRFALVVVFSAHTKGVVTWLCTNGS